MKKKIIRLLFLTVLLFLSSLTGKAVTYLQVGGPSKMLPNPVPPRGILKYANFLPHGASDYLMCTYNYVSAYKYTSSTLTVRCDYGYIYTETNYSSGNTFTYEGKGTQYYEIRINPINLIVPKTIELGVGARKEIEWSYSPNGVKRPTVEWSTQNSSIASVNSSGVITANAPGETTIKGKHDTGPDVEIRVKVSDLPVNTAEISSSYWIEAGESKMLYVSVTPYNASIKSTYWYIADGEDYISLSSSGTLTGRNPGTAEIYCLVNGTVTTNRAKVYVKEPAFTVEGTSPANEEIGVGVNVRPSVTFSHSAYMGDNFQNILMTNADNGTIVSGMASTSGNTLTFTPTQPLEDKTKYRLTVPSGAVKNQWGTHYTSTVNVDFYVGNCLLLTSSLESGFVEKDSKVLLQASLNTANIYYTIDGTMPTINSNLYTGEITIDKDIDLRAIAMADGYRQSNILSAAFRISNAEVTKFFPIDEQPLYLYHDVMPYVTYSNKIVESTNFDKITLRQNEMSLKCECFVVDSALLIVPDEPLKLGAFYTVDVPNDALRTWQGEICKATSWTFVTGNYAAAISTGGPELCTAIKTDGSLWTWGRLITEANTEDGSYSYTTQAEPSRFIDSEVIAVSSGYMHHAIVKRDGSLWMWGRQLCGEFGNGTTTASALPVKIVNDVKSVSCGLQTTAIVKTDGTLWMCGRNDLGQIDDSQMVKKQFVKVSEGVHDATLNWGSLVIVKTDGTTETRIWDMKADEQRKPAENSSITTEFAVLEYGWKNAMGLGEDGSVWTWNESSTEDKPTKQMEGRVSSELEGLTAITSTITIDAGKRSVLTAIPTPLNANYAKMMWSSGDSNVAEVSSRGVVTGISKGKTTVTAEISTDNGRSFSRTFSVIVEDGNLLKGDANVDGIVDGKDIVEISRYIMNLQPDHFNKTAADANSDGTINIKDIVEIVNVIKQ